MSTKSHKQDEHKIISNKMSQYTCITHHKMTSSKSYPKIKHNIKNEHKITLNKMSTKPYQIEPI